LGFQKVHSAYVGSLAALVRISGMRSPALTLGVKYSK